MTTEPKHPTSSADLALRLGMEPAAQTRLQRMPIPTAMQLPDDVTARNLMEFCSISSEDQTAMLAARPDPVRDPDWWTLLESVAAELRSSMDQPLPSSGYTAWPLVPEAAGPVGMFVYAWALLSVVTDLRETHARRNIPESLTRSTVAAIGSVMTAHREVTGVPGVGLFPLWGPPQRMCGVDFTLGRHDFTRAEMGFGDGVAGYVLQVHVPPTGRLDEAESSMSITEGLAFYARHYPDQPIAALVCKSWILDPQLAGFLAPESNLIRFQQRFQLLPHVPLDDQSEGDREMMRLGLHLQTPSEGPLSSVDLDRIPSTTTLHRAFTSHLRNGGHWHKRTGIQWLIH